jgi:hypothetical protein
MRTGSVFMLSTTLASLTFRALANGTVSPPNPVGEAVWRSHLLPQLIPVAIIVLAGLLFFVLWLIGRILHKHEQVEEVGPSW